MNAIDLEKLKEICTVAGFKKKGNAFFRVVGDGVFQVIKCEYEQRLYAYEIKIGLHSMYGPLSHRYFTSSGCIAIYDVCRCYEQKRYSTIFLPDMQTQLQILQAKVIPWLNEMGTQKKLVDAIRKLDDRWNDSAKIGPYLACGEHNHAKKVIKEIIGDYCFSKIRQTPRREETVEDLLARVSKDSEPFYGIIEVIDRGEEAIQAYLQANYEMNMQNAKFCVPK